MIDLDKASSISALFVGDAIMDEYVFVKTVGKAVKENALSSTFIKRESYKGGTWAAAAHARNFCRQVDIEIGPWTMWNSRMVDDVYIRKLFVTHEKKLTEEFIAMFNIREYDVVVVTDFGHGTMTPAFIERVTREARYLAVNAQTNATNFGFNLITKYPRADLVVVDELEARLAAHDRDGDIEGVIEKLGFERIIVTMGVKGAIGYDGAFSYAPALTDRALDSMGAGDALLAVVAPYAAAGLPMKDLLRIGNAAGAVKIGIVGHRESVTKEAVRERLGN